MCKEKVGLSVSVSLQTSERKTKLAFVSLSTFYRLNSLSAEIWLSRKRWMYVTAWTLPRYLQTRGTGRQQYKIELKNTQWKDKLQASNKGAKWITKYIQTYLQKSNVDKITALPDGV